MRKLFLTVMLILLISPGLKAQNHSDTSGHSFKKVSTTLGGNISKIYQYATSIDFLFYADSTFEFDFTDSTFTHSVKWCGLSYGNGLPFYKGNLPVTKDIWYRKSSGGGTTIPYSWVLTPHF
jgi:hypothetical protein